jgi:hypothetical protein
MKKWQANNEIICPLNNSAVHDGEKEQQKRKGL